VHEIGLCEELLCKIKENLPLGAIVKKVNIRIGKLSGVNKEAFRFAFSSLIQNTELHSAILNILDIPVNVYCRNCYKDVEIEPPIFICPYCMSRDLEIITGKELDLLSIDIEEE